MRQRKNLKRFYLLVVGCAVAAGVYYLTVTAPLIQNERDLDDRLRGEVDRLAEAGHGMNIEEVTDKIERLRADIDAFAAIGSDPARTIQFAPEVEEMLAHPFQLIDFDRRRFVVSEQIRRLSLEHKVALFENWEENLPSFASQPPYQLWAQLTAMDQLLRTAIQAEIASIDRAEILPAGAQAPSPEGVPSVREVSVRMQLTGQMETIHSIIMMLPLNGEELEALGINSVTEPKSSFFLSRFILKKSSAEDADEVQLDFVVSAFLDVAPSL